MKFDCLSLETLIEEKDMTTKRSNLDSAYEAIKAGHTIDCNGCKIWIDYSEHGRKDFIFWLYYGSSAETVSKKNLRWIMDVIACSDDFSFKVCNC